MTRHVVFIVALLVLALACHALAAAIDKAHPAPPSVVRTWTPETPFITTTTH
ncbi:hypothetical protein [Microbispora sp. KK1-11]|uniref:hypothetical protein n=1 Tax=Microbispora sp. KK1-11 TaxID=2053005 RepID=UPI00163D23FD|nr:hypothetical protein [Microbispora sp. KK1-11]